jgi:type IV pilus assembly protein PilE
MKRPQQGFTIVEVVVVTLIIAILAAIALPSYAEYVRRGSRSEARGQILQASVWLERFRTETGSYAGAVLPAGLSQSPPTGGAKYNIALGGLTATTYVITATPVGPMAGDACGNLTLNAQNQRNRTGAAPFELCWDR